MKSRLAPTPSGQMHLGNALAALLCWLSAKKQGMPVMLRIENLDLLRTSNNYTKSIMEDLLWLGLPWDEGPIYQSQRSSFYEECLATLGKKGLLYPCFCSRAELHAATAPHQSDGIYVYSGRCRGLTTTQQAAQNRPGAVRVRVPNLSVTVLDGCQGGFTQNLLHDCGDFILRRSDGVFAYQLAAPADDGAMGIAEVVRGRDLLSSAPRQQWLMEQLGYRPPRFCHLPMLLAPDGRRLSKRDNDLTLAALRTAGHRPQDIIGLLASLCGLLPKAQPATANALIPLFAWNRLVKDDIYLPHYGEIDTQKILLPPTN